MANGCILAFDVATPLEVKFKNQSTTHRAFVLTGRSDTLLGAIPL